MVRMADALEPVLRLLVARQCPRDVILPGDMKDLMNKVAEAKKGGRGQPHRAPGGDGGQAEPGQHGQVVVMRLRR
jgi:hypothetical protein